MIIPRLALGSIQPNVSTAFVARGLMAAFERLGLRVQSFCSQAVFLPDCGAGAITGRQQRHLDTWLMTPETCLAVFCHNMRDADVAVVEGQYQTEQSALHEGADFTLLCQWLDLPHLVVLDIRDRDPCAFRKPAIPVDGILLDGARDRAEYARWATNLEFLWRAPVLGGMPRLDELRWAVTHLQPRQRLPEELAARLGEEFQRWSQPEEILAIAARTQPRGVPRWQFPEVGRPRPFHVALAWDDAFYCYYPDTIDALEAMGVQFRMFSPLNDADLPDRTDMVYLGCGRIDKFAEALSANHCMRCALQRFALSGGRVYAECSGLAYLCQQIVVQGRSYPMVGVLPAVATRQLQPPPPRPTILRLTTNSWLGPSGTEVRGYLNEAWSIGVVGPVLHLCDSPSGGADLFRCRNVIGSRVHLNFAVQPLLLQHMVAPLTASRESFA